MVKKKSKKQRKNKNKRIYGGSMFNTEASCIPSMSHTPKIRFENEQICEDSDKQLDYSSCAQGICTSLIFDSPNPTRLYTGPCCSWQKNGGGKKFYIPFKISKKKKIKKAKFNYFRK